MAPGIDAPAGPVSARLVVGGTAYPLVSAVTTLGRGTDVDLRVDDPGVSRRHAELRPTPDGSGHSVIDLASTNGTFVGADRVGERLLADGDTIRIGSTTLTYRIG
jgi:pSer/pThr/pTyr-binding forkhead associated (FHA) protein